MEKERDEAKEEAQAACLAVVMAGEAKARAEDELARVQDALVVAEEARHRAEAARFFLFARDQGSKR